jgi:hypothetical protein
VDFYTLPPPRSLPTARQGNAAGHLALFPVVLNLSRRDHAAGAVSTGAYPRCRGRKRRPPQGFPFHPPLPFPLPVPPPTVSAKLKHPFPSSLSTPWVAYDDFDAPTFSTTRWDFTSSTCRYRSAGYNCWTTSPVVQQNGGGGTMNITAPGYAAHMYSWSSWLDAANIYGRNGVGYATYKNLPGVSTFQNTTVPMYFFATIKDVTTPSLTSYVYAYTGMVVYDLDANNYPHWLFKYYLIYYGPSSYSYIYYDYAYHYGSPHCCGYTNMYYVMGVEPKKFPMTLAMKREASSQSWRFGYSWPGDTTGAAFTDTGYSLYDYSLRPFNGVFDYSKFRIALYADSTYIYDLRVHFDWFGIFPATNAQFAERKAWYDYWSVRNATLAAYGACAVSRDMTKVVSSEFTSTVIKGLDGTSSYEISVAARDAVSKSAFNASVTPPVFPSVQLPSNLPAPLVFLDANVLPASASAGMPSWKDVTGKYTFLKEASSTGPFLVPKSNRVPYNTVQFRNAGSDMYLPNSNTDPVWQMDSTYTNHELSIFMVYQPANAAYYGQNSAVVARGGYFGYGESGWAVYAVNYYYSWGCTPTCNYLYGYSYGAHVKNDDYSGAATYGKYAEGPYGTAGVHPHSRSPTLVTYNYKKTAGGTYGVFQMDACQGIITQNNDMCNANQILGANNGVNQAGASQQWAPGARLAYYDQYVTTNRYTPSSTHRVNSAQTVRIGSVSWTPSWSSYSYAYVTDRMTGDLHSLLIYKGSTGLTNAQVYSAQQFLADRYFLRCPPVPAAPLSTGGCATGNVGSLCTLSCQAGAVRAGGSTSLRCSSGFFVGKNIFCAAGCPVMASPPDYATCSKYFVYDDFVPNQNFADMVMYDVAPALPTATASEFWAVDSLGRLVGNAPTLDDACAQATPSGLFANQPSWLTSVRLTDPLTTEVEILLDQGSQGGLIFRVLSNQTYYRLTVVGGGYSTMEKIVGGSPVKNRWRNSTAYYTAPGQWYKLSAFVQIPSQVDLTNTIIVTINGTVVWNITDGDIPAGSSGVQVTAGRVRFDRFGVSGSCDSNGDSCQNLVSGQECQFTCKPGFGLRGDYRQKCGSAGTITSAPAECVPLPPTVLTQNFNISEAAPINTIAGTIRATPAGVGQVIIFELLPQGNNETLRDRFGAVKGTASTVFRVGACSGELSLNTPGILDYYFGTRVFYLTVRACANARNDSCTVATMTITILRAPRAPIFEADPVTGSLSPWGRWITENVPVGTNIAPAIAAYTPEPNPIIYSIVFGNSDLTFGINNLTGMLTVNRAVLNFEQQTLYTLLVQAKDSVYTNLSNTVVVNVNVTNVNDRPTAAAVQEIQVIENSLATADSFVGAIRAMDEDAGDRLTYVFTSGGTNANFTLNASTGLLNVKQTKVYNPELDEVIIVNGLQTRDTLRFSVTITDSMGLSTVSQIVVYIIANITAAGAPILDAVELPNGGLRTRGGETIVLRGQNLDTIPRVALDPTKLYVFFATQVQDSWQRNYTAINCTVVSADLATCTSPQGFGSGLAITARWGNLRRQVLTSTVLIINYRVPTVGAVVSLLPAGDHRNMPTAGGLVLKLSGSNFGPEFLQTPASRVNPWPIVVQYGNNFEYSAFPLYDNVAVSYAAHDTILFSALEGVGQNLPMRVLVGGQTSAINNSTALLSYGRPVVTSFTMPAGSLYTASNMSTSGGEAFTINGLNFGPLAYPVTVRYAANLTVPVENVPTTFLFSYTATCRKIGAVAAHTTLSCVSAPGVGSGLNLTVEAAGQISARSSLASISYAGPVLTNIRGAGARLADTAGGQEVNLQGSNLGPTVLGDGAPDSVSFTPLTATYGPTGVEYVAVGCKVIRDIPNVLSCLTAPGTGTSHVWRVVVGGLDSGVWINGTRTGYAPPVISTFSRSLADPNYANGVKGYLTQGSEDVVLSGKNFGPAIVAGKFSALYRATLRDPTTDAALWDKPTTNATIGDERGVITFVPSSACSMTIPHKELVCTSTAGAGADLQWVITVDGQVSTFPITGYGRPRITSVVASNGVSPVTAASTDGQDVILLKGQNFGPRLNCAAGGADPCLGYVQSVRYGKGGVEYLARTFTVVDHQTIRVVLGPGFGQGLYFTVVVADQESDLSDTTFSYGVPVITSVTPSTADTDPTAKSPTTITIVGTDFSLLDTDAQLGVVFGNAEDDSLSGLLPIQTALPSWSNPAQVAAHVPGSAHTVSFLLPQGLSRGRAIRVVVYSRGNPTGYRVTSTPSLGSSSFDYTAPSIFAVVVQTPDAIPSNGSEVNDFRVKNFGGDTSIPVYVLTILGANFGPSVDSTGDKVDRLVEGRVTPVGSWDPAWGVVYKWDHKKLQIFTTQSSGWVRINVEGRAFGSGLPTTHTSNDFEYTNLSPDIGSLVGDQGPYDTRGGAVLAFSVRHLSSLVANLTVTVGGRDCPLLTLEGGLVDPTDVRNILIYNSSYYSTPGAPAGTINAQTEWTLRCRLPEGEGRTNAVIIKRDKDASAPEVFAAYQAPSITAYSIQQADGTWGVTTPYAVGAASILVPNEGALVRFFGVNFGLCPEVTMAESYLFEPTVVLGQEDVCGRAPANATNNTHTFLEFRAVRGDGNNFRIFVTVAGQSTADAFPVAFAYNAPTVAAYSLEGRTAGGDLISVAGADLGVFASPTVTIGGQPCTDVMRVNSSFLTCILAEGSGSNKDFVVVVNAQNWAALGGFRYSKPVISAAVVNGKTFPAGTAAAGSTTGGYVVELMGDNFGTADVTHTQHCLFSAWRNRDRMQPLTCNSVADFLGEGEIPDVAVTAWNHTYVSFVMPPGMGSSEFVPLVAGQTPVSASVFRYLAPNITRELDPNHGTTGGGDRITIVGENFGTKPVDTSRADVVAALFPKPLPTDLNAYLTAARPPTAHMVITFFKTCVSIARDARGFVPAVAALCASTLRNVTTGEEFITVEEHAHGKVRFLSAGGIGLNRTVLVTIYDEEPDDANPGQTRVVRAESNPVYFGYDAPKVTSSADSPVLQAGGGLTSIVTLSGINFGSYALQQAQQWTADEKRVEVLVEGVPAISADRVSRFGRDTLEIVLPDMTVGHKNISYAVAGQMGFTNSTDFAAVFTACIGGRRDPRTADPGPWTGAFGRPGEFCAPCPLGAVCAGFNSDLVIKTDPESVFDGGTHTYPRPVIGWFNLNSSDSKTSAMYGACPEQIASEYPGRDVCIVPCDPKDSCIGDNFCAYGYRSTEPMFRCSTCDVGFYRRAIDCVKCPDSPWALVIGFVLLVMAGGGLAYVLNKKKINLAFISIGVDYFQVIAIFANSKVAWPPALKELFHILSAFNLNIEIVAPECIVPNLAYKSKWTFIMVLPLAITLFFGILAFGSSFYKSLIKGQKVKLANQGAALASSVLLLMYVMYIYLTRNVLEIFNCSPTDPPDGKTYLSASAVFEPCGVPGGTQMSLIGAAVIALVVYVAGYPVALFALLYKNRESVMEDQLLRAKGVGNDKLTNPHAYFLRKRWSRTYYQFKPDLYFWTLVIIVRKFCIAATYILYNKNAAFQLAASMLIMFLAYAAQVVYYPYMSPADMEDVLKDHERKSFTSPVHARLRATIAGIETRGRRRVRKNLMNAEGKVDTKALLGVLRGWLFNYNTVEEILLFSAVIVALMGIMYSTNTSTNAAKNAYYAGARDAVTAVVLAVIISTIVYFVIVVVTEVYILSADAQRRKVAAKALRGKSASDKGAGPNSPKSPRRSPGMSSDEFIVGDVTAATNPMFLQQQKKAIETGGGGNAEGDQTAADAIRAMREPPPTELWQVYQKTYGELTERVNEMKRQLNAFSPEVRRMAETALRGEEVRAADFVDEDAVLASMSPKAAASPKATPKSPDSRENKTLLDKSAKKAKAAAGAEPQPAPPPGGPKARA